MDEVSVFFEDMEQLKKYREFGTIEELSKMEKEENILKFYYCESEDSYLIGIRVDTMYYAHWDGKRFVFDMSRYLPWGEHVVSPGTLWREHTYPDYSLYPELAKDTAYGMLTRGCPRINHGFCITPKKDGCTSRKVADLSEFWSGQKNVCLLDQNILACKERKGLLQQLINSRAVVEFNGGMDARYMTTEIIEMVRQIRVKDYHFAWDDPKEDLLQRFVDIRDSGIKNPNQVGVYVLTNYWSTTAEDLQRIYALRSLGFMPFVMIYDKQKYVDNRGRWLKETAARYTARQLQHFKVCQHMQRWAGNRRIIKSCPDFNNYEPYRKWIEKGMPVPVQN